MRAGAEGEASGAARRERWLFVDGAESFGGHEVMLLRWLEELAAQPSVEVSLLARADSQLRREGERHAEVFVLPKSRAVLQRVRDAGTFIRCVLKLKPSRIIVAEGCLLAQAHFVYLARLVGAIVVVYVPLVQTGASMGFKNGRMRDAIVRRSYANLPHGWITLSREQAEDFRNWSGVRRPILTLPNTVARVIEHTEPKPLQVSPHPGRRLRVLVLGRIEAHQKGHDQLLDYLAQNPQLGQRITVSFVGDGPFETTIRERLQSDSRLASWVSLDSWSPTLTTLQAHDLLLMTSRYEGVPLVMLEAMALGVPIVAPELPGTRPFLSATCLFPREDMETAFRRIDELLERDARLAMVERNRTAFEALASNEAFAKAVRSLTQALRALNEPTLSPRSA